MDTTKDGFISFEEFSAFEAVLCSPDALYLTAFEMFDTNASDNVSFEEFRRIIRHTAPVSALSFDFDSDFIKLYFGYPSLQSATIFWESQPGIPGD